MEEESGVGIKRDSMGIQGSTQTLILLSLLIFKQRLDARKPFYFKNYLQTLECDWLAEIDSQEDGFQKAFIGTLRKPL